MIKYIRFLYDVCNKLNDDSEKINLLHSIILAEARVNNDIASVILQTGCSVVVKDMPVIFQQFDTHSFELLAILGVSPAKLFDEEFESPKNGFLDLERSKTKYQLYEKKSQSELYDFYIRKTKLLVKLSSSGSLSRVNIRAKSRLRNIEYATRILCKRLK